MQTDGFAQMLDDAVKFYGELKENNAREWFAENKKRYEAEIKKPADLLSSIMAEEIGRIAGGPCKAKIFRINRDVRFSKDKSPYNAHLHMLWTTDVGGGQAPGWFFGLAPDYTTVGYGFMGFDGEALTRWRAFVDREGDALAAEIGKLTDAGGRMHEAQLKRVPAPYPKDHPHEALLRRKGCAVWRDLSDELKADGGVVTALRREFERYLPLHKLMGAAV